ncbi:insulinase family protein [Archangium minus]|uniref:Insulinase family protein n=1 Tax=Archangium minus TaxID=83450 RepID=A0ABY9WJW2_9BACT|nr:insulinase family protein [Archangium minus]
MSWMKGRLGLLMLVGWAIPVAAAPQVHSRRLDNGLEVVVVERHALPLVTVELAVRAGAQVESPEYNGLSHLFEHLFGSDEDRRARLRELGVKTSAFTSVELVDFPFSTTPEHLEGVLTYLRDGLVSPRLHSEALKREQVGVTNEMNQMESMAGQTLYREVHRRLWWKYPSYKDQLGTRQAVLGATPEHLRTLHARYFVPNNSLLVVAGDVRAADVFAQVERVFRGWARAPDPFELYPRVVHPPLKGSEVVVDHEPVGMVKGGFHWQGPSGEGPGAELASAARLLGYLTEDPTSHFQKALVESGTCVSASLSWYEQRNVGPLDLDFEAAPERVDECLRAVLAELTRLKDEGLTDEALRAAVRRMEVDQALDRERTRLFSRRLVLGWSVASVGAYLTSLEDARRVRREDLVRLLDTYVLGKPFVLGVMLSPEVAEQRKLDVAHFERLVGVTR